MNILWRTLPEKLIYAASMAISRYINGGKNPRAIPYQRILCIKLDEIGDLCYALHVPAMLRAQYPDAGITLLCKPFAVSLTQHDPNIDSVTSSWDQLTGNYDLIVDLRGSWKSNWYALRTHPKARVDRGTVRYRNRRLGSHPHEVITNLQIVEPLIAADKQQTNPRIVSGAQAQQQADAFLAAEGIGRFAILHAGARKALRRWDKFAELAAWLQQQGLAVVFVGDESEATVIDALRAQIAGKTYSSAGKLDLAELAALCKRAALFIGNESGPLHIASVSGAPALGLFGPGEPFVFYPRGEKTAYLHHVLPCNPCDQVYCVHPENPCIRRIGMQEVIEKIKSLSNEIRH